MFFSAAYGVDDSLHYFAAECSCAVLVDFMRKQVLSDLQNSFEAKRHEYAFIPIRSSPVAVSKAAKEKFKFPKTI